MKKSKLILKILAILAAVLLLVGLVALTDDVTGYPVSYLRVRHAVKECMADNYGNTDYVAGKPRRAWKLGGFLVDVTSPSDPDVDFTLHFYFSGELWYDGSIPEP